MKVFGSMHGLKLAAAVVAALALGACAKNPTDVGALDTRGGAGGAGGAGARAPRALVRSGSPVNVGDRVSSIPIFPTCRRQPKPRSTSRPNGSRNTPLHLHYRRPCRRARHARI